MPTIGGLTAGYLPGADGDGSQDTAERGERGYRRRKLTAMAGNLYRTGQQAVTDFRDSYAQVRARGLDDEALVLGGSPHIPGSFPDVAITSQGDEQMVLFPSYAKRHVRKDWSKTTPVSQPQTPQTGGVGDETYWRHEWERHEDEKAVVDVDVRGWIYSPQTGPMTKRNRMLVGLARQLSGVSAPNKTDSSPIPSLQSSGRPRAPEETRDQEWVSRQAALIERRGRDESRIAQSGGERRLPSNGRLRENRAPGSRHASPAPSARLASNANELSDAELALANANLMARLAPFLTSPRAALPLTLFFYNDEQSQSRTVSTNDAGHFAIRAQLDFVPTSVRVLANERLSATQDVEVIEPTGVSLISDVDDTVKHSNISAGAREIFRNTFVRELAELEVDGVKEWYGEMGSMGVDFHYCSNSPWQLFPVLASFFKLGGLPPGSLHLKQYSGMLQGIFEPVAERKKATLHEILADFPRRKFLLVGDSGEADLEVYTELALANPGRVLAVFIRDVTTVPDKVSFFDSAALDLPQRKMSSLTLDDDGRPPDEASAAGTANGPETGLLIDFSSEPADPRPEQVKKAGPSHKGPGTADLLSDRKPPPPPPTKPAALRSRPSAAGKTGHAVGLGLDETEAPPKKAWAPRLDGVADEAPARGSRNAVPPPPPPARRTAASSRNLSPPPPPAHSRRASSNSGVEWEPLPPPPGPSFGLGYFGSGSRSGASSPTASPVLGANKKLDLWLRRLERAHEALDRQGVALYTWRRGQDVMVEAAAIVREALRGMERGG